MYQKTVYAYHALSSKIRLYSVIIEISTKKTKYFDHCGRPLPVRTMLTVVMINMAVTESVFTVFATGDEFGD